MKKPLALLAALTLTGCLATLPNQINTQVSNFDGTREIVMEPGWVYADETFMSGGAFRLGLRTNTKMKDSVIIKVEVNDIYSIPPQESLLFNIDGEIVSLSSDNTITSFDSEEVQGQLYSESSRDYIVQRSFIEKILSANSVKVKLLTSKGYREGDLLNDKHMAAIIGFRNFMAATSAL